MKAKNYSWIIPGLFFLLCSLLNLTGRIGWEPLARGTKPALLPLIALTSVAAAGGMDSRGMRLLVTAQLLGCVGDVFLMYSGFYPFICGMIAFLAGHVFYMTLFGGFSWKGLGIRTWIPALLVMMGLVATLITVIGVEGDLLVPMCVYGMALMLLCFTGIAGVARLKGEAWWRVLCGALLFTVSDALIAVETFQESPARWMGFAVMLTYISAQALLATGAVKLLKEN